jgi:phage-related tail protein
MREGIRVEYDRLKERVDAAQLRLEAENKKDKQDKKVIENLDNLVKRHGDDLTQMEKQMKSIDETIQAKEGIDEKMEGLRTVLELIKEHIKKL